MSTLFFYLILGIVVIAIGWLFLYQRKQVKKGQPYKKREPIVSSDTSSDGTATQSAYDSDIIVLKIQAFPDRPFMGYDLLQTLLSVGLQFGEMNIFHRYEDKDDKDSIAFSVAAATSEGAFPMDDMGGFKCLGLIIFMKLNPKRKLMARFDLMLDVARQLIEELGGEIYDDLRQPISAAAIRRLREKICAVETNNLYAADLLDNLD